MMHGNRGSVKCLKLLVAAGIGFLGLTPAAHAALAPNYQRLAELKAILAHPQLLSAFAVSDPIIRIEYRTTDRYLVVTAKCQLPVRIVDRLRTNGLVGARQFDVVPGTVHCPPR